MKRMAWMIVLLTVPALAGSLDDLWQERTFRLRRVSSYDPSGGNADGGQDKPIQPGEVRVLAEITGPAIVRHIWITIGSKDKLHLKNLWLRAYWDGEPEPSIDTPIGDFFCQGHGEYFPFACRTVSIGNQRGLNCFWPMPFNRSARVVVENRGDAVCGAFYYYIDYEQHKRAIRRLRTFHAQYRAEAPVRREDNYTFLYAEGEGHFVGVFHTVKQNENGWWGEGDDMIFVDGEPFPSLHGTGSEDYFCHAWGMGSNQAGPYFGALMNEGYRKEGRHSHYRFHIEDPIPFRQSIHVTMEHGHANDRADDFTSVAYWYQTEPHRSYESNVPVARVTTGYDELVDLLARQAANPRMNLLRQGREALQRHPGSPLSEWLANVAWERGSRKDSPPTGIIYAALVHADITVDGTLDEPIWTRSAWTSGFARGDRAAEQNCRVAIARNAATLYLALQSEEDPATQPLITLTPADIVEASNENRVFDEDCAEFFVGCVPGDLAYYQLIVNPAGALFLGRGRYDAPDHAGRHWQGPVAVGSTRVANRWTLEVALPLASIADCSPAVGDLWRIAVRRVRRTTDGRATLDRWPTAPWDRGGHLAPLFGYLQFE